METKCLQWGESPDPRFTWEGRWESDGGEVIAAIPLLSPTERIFITNVGQVDLVVRPSCYEPIEPGETREFRGAPQL
jgi:hypothetical protein